MRRNALRLYIKTVRFHVTAYTENHARVAKPSDSTLPPTPKTTPALQNRPIPRYRPRRKLRPGYRETTTLSK